ncbi:MAG: metallophosphoesterase [Candidatus Paceibacterota bacterium]
MTKERNFVIGDIHSHHDEMMELFEMVNFDFDNDILISLGDLVDRGPDPIEVIETLMKIKNFIHILGNHDDWFFQYLLSNIQPSEWVAQGGQSTLNAYHNNPEYKERHLAFFQKASLYYIDDQNRLFIHGGFNHRIPFSLQRDDKERLIWDRALVHTAMEYEQYNQPIPHFDEIYVGHTPTQFIKESTPTKFSNLWMLDTGVYISGKLSIMNIETKEYWQTNSKGK